LAADTVCGVGQIEVALCRAGAGEGEHAKGPHLHGWADRERAHLEADA
jgi:hypothetical protein